MVDNLTNIENNNNKYPGCYIVFPQSLYKLMGLIKYTIENNHNIKCTVYTYESKNLNKEQIKEIKEKLQDNWILILGYLGELNVENSYKLGLAYAYKSCVILIDFNYDTQFYIEIPQCIKYNFFIHQKIKQTKDVDVLLSILKKIVNVVLCGNIYDLMYEEAIGFCNFIETKKRCEIRRIEKEEFIANIQDNDIELYLKYEDKYYHNLFKKIISNEEDIHYIFDTDMIEDSNQNEVFISYAWRSEIKEPLVEKIEQVFLNKNIKILRDKDEILYKGRLREFMQRLSRGKCVILIISEPYLKSKYCMYELVEISKHGEFYDRIFPIILPDAKIYEAIDIIKYVQHWEQKITELNDAMRTVNAANLKGCQEELNLFTEIRNTFNDLTTILSDMNNLQYDSHIQSGFEVLLQAILDRLN